MGYINCQNIGFNSGRVTCDLDEELPAGSWYPKLITENGLIRRDPAVSNTVVLYEITNVSPSTGLNPAGGNILTIAGENFPANGDSQYNLSIMIGG